MMQNIREFNGIKPQMGQRVFVDPSAIVTGDVILGDDVSIWPGTSVRGDLLTIKIGARTNIQDNSVIHTTHASQYHPEGHAVTIGEDVTVGHRVILHGCTIEDFCLIGMGSIILDGVVVQKEVLVGAGSLVPQGKVLESGFLYLGSPVKKVRPLTSDEKDFFRYSAKSYVELKNLHLNLK